MKNLTIVLVTMIFSLSLLAQPPKGKEKMKAHKIAFLTEKLNLSPEEAQTFWPVYNEYENKQEELRKSQREQRRAAKENMDELSDDDVIKLINSEFEFKQKDLDLSKSYHEKFMEVLPVKKVGRLYRAEEMFKRELLHKLKEGGGRGEGHPHSPHRGK